MRKRGRAGKPPAPDREAQKKAAQDKERAELEASRPKPVIRDVFAKGPNNPAPPNDPPDPPKPPKPPRPVEPVVTDYERKLAKQREREERDAKVPAAQASQQAKNAAAAEAAAAQRLAEEAAIAEALALETATYEAQEALNAKLIAEETARMELEKNITQEKLKQSAEAKVALKTALQGAAGAPGLGGIGGAIAGGGSMLAIGLAVGAAVADAVSTSLSKIVDIRQSDQEGFQASGRMRNIERKTGGIGEQAAAQNAQAINSQLEEAQAKKGSFQNTEPVRDFLRGFGNAVAGIWNFKPFEKSGEKGERKNELDIKRLAGEKGRADDQALRKAEEGTSGLEVKKTEEELQGHLGVARAIQFKIDYQKDYEEQLRKAGAISEDTANAAQKEEASRRAGIKLEGEFREEAMKFGSLVNARSGAGDIARAAGGAQAHIELLRQSVGKLSEIHALGKDQHAMVMNATRNRYGRGG